MRRVLVALLAVILVACTSPSSKTIVSHNYAEQLLAIDREVGQIQADQYAGRWSGMASVEIPAEVERQGSLWGRLAILRLQLMREIRAPSDRNLRDQCIRILECYQRECEYRQAYTLTQDEAYRLKAAEAEREGDRLRRSLWDQLYDAYPDLFAPTAATS